jgi:hypothetical protein
LGEIGFFVGVTVGSGMNLVAWITGFFFSRHQKDHIWQAFMNGLVNAGCWLLIVNLTDLGDVNATQMGIAAFIGGVVIFYLCLLVRTLFGRRKSVMKGALSAAAAVRDSDAIKKVKSEAATRLTSLKKFDPNDYSDELFEKALHELETEQLKKSTWAKCIATSEGDQSVAKAKYIELRVKELSTERE